jgi:cystathionine beta-lyase
VVLDERLAQPQVDAFIDALKLFRIGYSWGGSTSLVVPYDMRSQRSAVPWQGGALVRFSIGLEDPRDLIADLAQALRAMG